MTGAKPEECQMHFHYPKVHESHLCAKDNLQDACMGDDAGTYEQELPNLSVMTLKRFFTPYLIKQLAIVFLVQICRSKLIMFSVE